MVNTNGGTIRKTPFFQERFTRIRNEGIEAEWIFAQLTNKLVTHVMTRREEKIHRGRIRWNRRYTRATIALPGKKWDAEGG